MTWGLAADVATVIASLSVILGVVQFWLSKRQAQTDFEDDLSREYRTIVKELPVEALLGKSLSPEVLGENLGAFFRYFDLCTEQRFLHKKKRVSQDTWIEWEKGIKSNLAKPAFKAALEEINNHFDRLNASTRLEHKEFKWPRTYFVDAVEEVAAGSSG